MSDAIETAQELANRTGRNVCVVTELAPTPIRETLIHESYRDFVSRHKFVTIEPQEVMKDE